MKQWKRNHFKVICFYSCFLFFSSTFFKDNLSFAEENSFSGASHSQLLFHVSFFFSSHFSHIVIVWRILCSFVDNFMNANGSEKKPFGIPDSKNFHFKLQKIPPRRLCTATIGLKTWSISLFHAIICTACFVLELKWRNFLIKLYDVSLLRLQFTAAILLFFFFLLS